MSLIRCSWLKTCDNMVDEKKYPMNLDEFKKRCTELLIEVLGEPRREKIFKFMQSNPDYVERLYLDTCGFYDDEEIYGTCGYTLGKGLTTWAQEQLNDG